MPPSGTLGLTGTVRAPYDANVIPTRGARQLDWSLLAILLVISLSLSACGSSRQPTAAPSPSNAEGPPVAASSPPAEGSPGATPEASSTPPPSGSPSASPSESSSPPPSASAGPSTTSLPNPNPAAACSGSDRNRDFYAAVAEAVEWDVYCAVLPAGWYVDRGTYRLANGGRLEIAYNGPGGARFELREGAFCSEAGGCVPPGTEGGEAAFGDRSGVLVELADGGWAIVVDRGQPISWLAVGEGLTETEFVDLAARLARVDA